MSAEIGKVGIGRMHITWIGIKGDCELEQGQILAAPRGVHRIKTLRSRSLESAKSATSNKCYDRRVVTTFILANP
jgi:hypothetical protein